MKKMDYPAFWHYTTLDALNRLIPQGISPEIVITKELLDKPAMQLKNMTAQ